MKLRTLKDIEQICCGAGEYCDDDKMHIHIDKLKQETIKDIKFLEKKNKDANEFWDDEKNRFCPYCKSGCYECNCRIRDDGKIEYIKWKFNITEEDLKYVDLLSTAGKTKNKK